MFKHETVLLDEAIEALNIKEDGIYVDCTLGGGGHSSLILERLTTGKLYAFDQDQNAIDAATVKLEKISNNFEIIKSNFALLKDELLKRNVTAVDGVLFDLGVSSPQFDVADRGFSYHQEGKLDMRMNQSQEKSAYNVVNNYEYNQLVSIFFKYGEEKYAKQIARKIEKYREEKPIETTTELVDVIKSALPEKAKRGSHPAKKVFQAIRIEVNDELNVFEKAINEAIEITGVGGRIAVITFHSLEDRICKNIFKENSTVDIPKGVPILDKDIKPVIKLITRKPIIPSDDEITRNRRSRSSKLRVAEKL